jgi:hypothetical protein
LSAACATVPNLNFRCNWRRLFLGGDGVGDSLTEEWRGRRRRMIAGGAAATAAAAAAVPPREGQTARSVDDAMLKGGGNRAEHCKLRLVRIRRRF